MAFVPSELNTGHLLKHLNEVEPAIQFTLEKEKDGQLPFLDVIIRRFRHGLKFSVYREPANKDDFVHYF